MAKFLSDEWISEMDTAARTQAVNIKRPVTIKEVINDGPDGSVAYVMTLDETVSLVKVDSLTHDSDVSIAQDYETAVALHRGELGIRDAFFAGRIKVAGNLNLLLDNTDVIAGLAPVFADVRSTTVY